MTQQAISNLPQSEVRQPQPRFNMSQRQSIMGYLLVLPVVLCLMTLVIYPFFYAIYISFTDRMVGQPGNFIG
ncbi:MAG: hypothetical protein KDJ52_36065, partial [Anaerolineae bacterium]|nr:hypothetical protein [Anaerolineae bacterium]